MAAKRHPIHNLEQREDSMQGARPVAFSLVCLVCLLVPHPARASDWPQFKRDAARTGDAADETLVFPLQRVLAVRFSAPIYASAAVVGEKVYAVDQRGLLACIDRAAQRVLWHARIGGVCNLSSPAVAGGKVFVGSTAGYLLILDAATGKESARVPAEGGIIAAPAVANDAVYFCSFNGRLSKVDFSGKLVWSYDGGKASEREFVVEGKGLSLWAGPPPGSASWAGKADPYAVHLITDQGDRCAGKLIRRADWDKTFNRKTLTQGVVLLNSGILAGFPELGPARRGTTFLIRGLDLLYCYGEKNEWIAGGNWKAGEDGGGPPGPLSQPVLAGAQVVVGGANGRIYFYNLTPAGSSAGQPVWTYATSRLDQPNGGVSATAAVAGGTVYVGGEDGILYGLGQGKEAEVISVLPESARAPEPRPGALLKGPEWPTIGGDMTYSVVSPDTILKPPLKVQWKSRIGGFGGQNSVVVAAGKVFAASCDGLLEALDAESGELLWRTRHPFVQYIGHGSNPNNGPPTYAEGKVLVLRLGDATFERAARNTGLWCHAAQTGEVLWHKTRPELYPNFAGCSQGEGVVVHQGKVLVAWHEKDAAVETAALDLGTGKELWRVRQEGIFPPIPADPKGAGTIRVSQGALGDGTWFLSACAMDKQGTASGGATLALDPADGKVLWKNAERFVTGSAGLNFRNGIVVVYHCWKAGHALDAKTGRHLWSSAPGPWHLQPLTDEYLASQGRKGVSGGYCTDPIWVNGVLYGQIGPTGKVLFARAPDGKELWRYVPLSSACPSPAPAYGRLYYAAWGEGVVYCFSNQEPDPAEKHAGLGKRVLLARPFSPMNPGPAGGKGLTDGVRAAVPNFQLEAWHGIQEHLEFVVDMDAVTSLRTLAARFLQDPYPKIFLPATVEYAVSSDGKEYRVVKTVKHDLPEDAPVQIKAFTAEGLQEEARYIRVRAQRHKQGNNWLFIDELVINPPGDAQKK